MKGLLHYLFLPHEKNSYRAKLLHHKSLLLVILILFFGSFFLSFFKVNFPSVLGISTDISSEKLLFLVNKEREARGLLPLRLNPQLTYAAAQKAEDMFAKDYWAHNSPDGKTPWVFIRDAGYDYTYAGENLAKGFNSSQDVVDAWMASPTHKTNLLAQNYRDVGFAVIEGRLNGDETALVVQEFGNRGGIPIASVYDKNINQEIEPSVNKTFVLSKSFINSLSLSSNIDRIIMILFIVALLLDMVVVERKKIIRFVGHNIDHIFFLAMILSIIGMLGKGAII